MIYPKKNEPKEINKRKKYPGIGIDIGAKVFITLSTGKTYPNIYYDKKIQRLIKLVELTKVDKPRYCKKYTSIINKIMRAYIHEIVREIFSMKPSYITIESFSAVSRYGDDKGNDSLVMAKPHFFIKILTKQCKRHNTELRQVGLFYPSSKLCSNCHSKETHSEKKSRLFVCEHCGYEIDRDINSARNLKRSKKYSIIVPTKK